MVESRGRLGDLLVAAGYVTEEQVEHALARQRETGLRLGEQLVVMGLVSELQLVQALSSQLAVPWVALTRVDFTRELLDHVPAEVAERYGLIPVFLQRRSRTETILHVAMEDPTSQEALSAVRRAARTSVRPMVAPPSEIRNAIRVYYFGGQHRPGLEPLSAPQATPPTPPPPPSSAESTEGRGEPPPPPPAASRDGAEQAKGAGAAEPSARSERAAAVADAARDRAASEPTASPGPGDGEAPADSEARSDAPDAATRTEPKVVTFTLLDGTVVRLPVGRRGRRAAGASTEAASSDALTARDLVAALDARMEGKDVSGVLPDDRWEPLLAALLQVLLDKGLVADWEFVEAWKKHRRGPKGSGEGGR